MKNALIIHGVGGYPEENWFMWLKEKLERKGYKVWLPQLPNCDRPDVDLHNKFLLSGEFDFNNETILIGHSSGAVETLSLLDNLPYGKKIKKAILVAGFIDNLNREALDGLFIHKFNYDNIKSKVDEIVLVHSDDDPYVPLEHGKFLKKVLNAKLIIKKGQKHFSIGSFGKKYKEFPLILELTK